MKIAPVADVKARFSSYLEQSEKGPIIVTKNGRPVAALVAVGDERGIRAPGACPHTEISWVARCCGAANQTNWRQDA